MVDPTKITKYNQTQAELEEMLLFWVCAAGKNGVTAARCLDSLLSAWRVRAQRGPLKLNPSPFDIIKYIWWSGANLAQEMKKHGIGCYNAKSKTFRYLVGDRGKPDFFGYYMDLQKCTVEDLESVPGIGPKTARCFLIHSRKNQRYAGLDTHILKFLRDKGHEVPASTPTGKKYRDLEQTFLKYVDDAGMNVADFDLMIWNDYRNRRAS
jgi:hypothetical protein